jgi:hypothetical protein
VAVIARDIGFARRQALAGRVLAAQ